MNENLWRMPVPVTGIIQGPFVVELLGRQYEVSFSIEDEIDGEIVGEKELVLLFDGVQAFKCTHWALLHSIDDKLLDQSYGSLISLGNSSWLDQTKMAYTKYHTMRRSPYKDLYHFMICFDDGPCYEFLAESWSHYSRPSQNRL